MATTTAANARRDAARRQALEQLEQATADLLTSEGWRSWLRVRATLPTYSARNTLLLLAQAQERGIELTHVAGFKAWLRLGRCVRRGETALKVFAPLPARAARDRDRDDTGPDRPDEHEQCEAPAPRLRFRLANVFALSQIEPLPDRDPVPLEPPRAPVDGDSHAHLLPRLEAFAASVGYPVERVAELGGAEGHCHHRDRRIRLVDRFPANHQLAVLIHELAHALQGPQPHDRYARNEVTVEAVAFIVTQVAGVDSSCASAPYIASWAEDDPMDAVRAAVDEIDTLARRLQAALEGDPAPPPAAGGALIA